MSVKALLRICRARGWHVTTAESCTGGMLGAALTQLPGSSDVYERGFITYSNAAKIKDLGVSQATLSRFGAVSEQVAGEMAVGALARSKADLAVSITGIAGPGGSEQKPEGRVCFGLASDGFRHVDTVEFGPLGRDEVRAAATDHAVTLLLMAAQTRS